MIKSNTILVNLDSCKRWLGKPSLYPMKQKSIKSVIKAVTPPFLVSLYKRPKQDYGFFGDYSSWEEAVANSTGYDSELILNKVRDALLQVKAGKAVYERDSVLFDHIEYSFPVLAALLKVALENNGNLSVLDFGGSLGSSYYQCKDFLNVAKELSWNIVEQPKFVECGKKYFQNDQLKFYLTIEECLSENTINIILLSSVLQYLEKPFHFLENIGTYKVPYLLIDRTSLTTENRDIITVQNVSKEIYDASYPTWFFCEDHFLNLITSQGYGLITSFLNSDGTNIESCFFKGYFLGPLDEK